MTPPPEVPAPAGASVFSPAVGRGGAPKPRAGAPLIAGHGSRTRSGGIPPSAPRRAVRAGRSRAGGVHSERGSQALEFALVLPLGTVLVVLLLHAALLGVDLVVVQGLAREAARVAAVDDDAAARAALRRAAGPRPVELALRPPARARAPGDLVTADLRLRSHAFARFGVDVWLPAQATMRVEDA